MGATLEHRLDTINSYTPSPSTKHLFKPTHILVFIARITFIVLLLLTVSLQMRKSLQERRHRRTVMMREETGREILKDGWSMGGDNDQDRHEVIGSNS